jgi:hypothetical protein
METIALTDASRYIAGGVALAAGTLPLGIGLLAG